jgi:hypothetical protein
MENVQHLILIEEMCGPFPKEFISKSERSGKYFDENSKVKPSRFDIKRVSIRDKLISRNIELPEWNEVEKFFKKMIAIDPKHRSDPGELLEDRWLNTLDV